MTGSYQCSLVANVGYVGTRETWSLTCQKVYIEVFFYLQRTQMYLEDSLTLVDIRQVDMNLTVEAPSTQQCFVQNIRTIRSSQNDNTTIRSEAVHFR